MFDMWLSHGILVPFHLPRLTGDPNVQWMFESISTSTTLQLKKYEKRRHKFPMHWNISFPDTTCHRIVKWNHKRFYGKEMHIFSFLNERSFYPTDKEGAICYCHKESHSLSLLSYKEERGTRIICLCWFQARTTRTIAIVLTEHTEEEKEGKKK